jgi:hypothetical protein
LDPQLIQFLHELLDLRLIGFLSVLGLDQVGQSAKLFHSQLYEDRLGLRIGGIYRRV